MTPFAKSMPNMVVKKKGGKDVEVPDGWVGHILPFDLVQGKYLTSDLAENCHI